MKILRSCFCAAALFAGPALAQDGDRTLGDDLAGEACVLRQADILCGPALAPGGRLLAAPLNGALPAAEPARAAAIAAIAAALPQSGLAGASDMRCGAGRALGGELVLFTCTASSTGWPHAILAQAAPGRLVLAEGLPSLLPVLQAALAAQTGAALSPAQTGAALEAIRAAYPARALSVGAQDHAGYMRSLDEAGRAGGTGDFAGAEAAYRSALDIATRSFGPDSAAIGSTLMELALQVSNQQRFDEAEALFRRATPIVESAPSPEIRARLSSYRGLNAANQRDYVTALRYARDDVAVRQAEVDAARASALDVNGNIVQVPARLEAELAHALRIQAEMAMRLDDMAGAQAAAERALYIVTQHPELPLVWRPDMVSLMGEINARLGRVVVAEKNFLDALAMYRKLFGDGAPAINAQLRLGRFYAGEQVYAASRAAYREAFAAMARQTGARSGAVILDQLTPFFAAALAGGEDGARLDNEMFLASQMFDSGVAGQTIARVAASRAAGDPALARAVRAADDAERRREELRMNLAAEQARAEGQRDPAREQTLAASLASAVTESETQGARLRADFPAYMQLAAPGPVSLAAMQRALRPREAFASFVIGVRDSYVLLVTRDGLTVRPLPVTRDGLAADIADLRNALTPRLGAAPDFSLANAAALYRELLGPVGAQLSGIDRLSVAAGGVLSNLPFALLVTDAAGPQDFVHAAWLVRRVAVSQIPSARAFLALRTTPAPAAARPFLGAGNPGFGGTQGAEALAALASACQTGAAADPALLRSLPPLPETADEVRTIAASFNAGPDDVLLGAGAGEAALRARPLDQYGILYFATHAMLPGELHCQAQPGLALTPPAGTAGPEDDGLLTAAEIGNFHLNADLVVLSACNTAAAGGNGFGGVALEGLADAFFSAGAHAVLASHWEVPSLATAGLMTGLFAHLAQDPGRDTAEALRQAQLSLIAQEATANPYAWAAFTLVGDGL